MTKAIAVIGAGVSGLTTAVVFAEHGYQTAVFAEKIGADTTSAAAAAIWFPYDTGPGDTAIQFALETFHTLTDLARQPDTGVSMIEFRSFSRNDQITIPEWSRPLGAKPIESDIPAGFVSGFAVTVPLTDTTIYLDYLLKRFEKAGGEIHLNKRFDRLEDVDPQYGVIVNCAGIGARELVPDPDLEPHRGQIAIVAKLNLPGAIVSDDPPLMYAIPRTNDCVFGGTNVVSDDCAIDPEATVSILNECSRVLGINPPSVVAQRVGLRPFRRSGVRVERGLSDDGRIVIHNYGHGGSGFTLSWGCAEGCLEELKD